MGQNRRTSICLISLLIVACLGIQIIVLLMFYDLIPNSLNDKIGEIQADVEDIHEKIIISPKV